MIKFVIANLMLVCLLAAPVYGVASSCVKTTDPGYSSITFVQSLTLVGNPVIDCQLNTTTFTWTLFVDGPPGIVSRFQSI
jgi:hypothetical protein